MSRARDPFVPSPEKSFSFFDIRPAEELAGPPPTEEDLALDAATDAMMDEAGRAFFEWSGEKDVPLTVLGPYTNPYRRTPGDPPPQHVEADPGPPKEKVGRGRRVRVKTPPPPRRRYPRGTLQAVALARAREIVRLQGAEALTLRGLARDLGVSAPALLYYFGTRAGMRAAVAAEVEEDLSSVGLVRGPPTAIPALVSEMAGRWIGFAAEKPNLYRLAFGDGWHGPGVGWGNTCSPFARPTDTMVREVSRLVDRGVKCGAVTPEDAVGVARLVAFGVHGLAMARADGVPADLLAPALDALIADLTRRCADRPRAHAGTYTPPSAPPPDGPG